MTQGTIKWFSDESGYGFIRPDEGGENLFVRRLDVTASNAHEPLEKGDEVDYEKTQGGKGLQATNVSRRRRYSWRDDCLERHEGKEARQEYYSSL
jgi:CspA family cold shock protein